ncbi:hypothetical protein HI914_02115 [Erysiphe necator]|nr:hypothetical protein HI914_02115 [Erysiphe necator]
MISPLSTDNVMASKKNKSHPATCRKVTPAIPLSFLRIRQQIQAKRATILLEAKNAAQPSLQDIGKQEDPDEKKTLPQCSDISIKSNGIDNLMIDHEPNSLIISALAEKRVENTAELCSSKEPPDKLHNESKAANVEARVSKEETGHLTQKSNQTDNLSPNVVSGTLFKNDNLNFKAGEISNQQSTRVPIAHVNEKIMVCDNSESSKSSPAPPQSTAHPTPSFNYEQPLPGRHLTHRFHSGFPLNQSNIYSPLDQPPSCGYYVSMNGPGNPVPGDQFCRRQAFPVRSWQDISPAVNQIDACRLCDPTTPHSFQGSYSSAQERDFSKNFDIQASPAISNNRFSGNLDFIRNCPTNSLINANRDNYPPPLPILQNNIPQVDLFDGLIKYLSSQFANPTFADYNLELRYSDDRAAPVRIPGHSLIFARSIKLRHMILSARNETDGVSSKTLLIESDDRFLSTDGVYLAVHRLYGSPLLDLGAIIPIGPTGQYQLPSISISNERFDLALGYAAAGHLLKMEVVVDRGCEIASLALNWINLERALDFALDGGLEPQWKIHSWDPESPRATYGPSVNLIIVKAIGFICHNLPVHFQLDTSVSEARFALRLPKTLGQRQSCLSSHLSHIKFGDHTAENCSQLETQQIPTVVLSRILISLPWELLRYIFESPHLANTIESLNLRHQILMSVVQEREKRRLRVYNSPVPNLDRQKDLLKWKIVGWKEEVEALRGDEIHPKLIRSWADFRNPES